ncbi:MAG: hypothetical protein ACREL1_08760, partial [bacterium]
MPQIRPLLFIGLTVAAFALCLPACGPKANVQPSGPVTITYWEKWTGFEGAAIKTVVDGYNQSQTHVHVNLVIVSQIEKKLLVATAGGDPPDLSGLYSRNVQVYAQMDALQSLDSGLTEHHI